VFFVLLLFLTYLQSFDCWFSVVVVVVEEEEEEERRRTSRRLSKTSKERKSSLLSPHLFGSLCVGGFSFGVS
jgi:hypothetical protein